jgi:hypothetical protein
MQQDVGIDSQLYFDLGEKLQAAQDEQTLKGLDIKVKDENALRQALTDTIVQNLQNVTATGQYRSKTGALGGKIT